MLNEALTMVLLPGFDGTGDLFKEFVASLPPGVETRIIPYPGCEKNSYADLLNLVQAGVPTSRPIIVVAESFSVPIAVLYAATNPSNLKALILCAGFARSPVRGVLKSMLRLMGPMLFRIAPPKLMIRSLLVGSGAPDSLVNNVRRAISSVQPRVLADRLQSVLTCDVRNNLAKIKVPMLYLRARRDRIVAASWGQEIANLNPLCTIADIEGPHLLLQQNPTESAHAIMRFIKELPG